MIFYQFLGSKEMKESVKSEAKGPLAVHSKRGRKHILTKMIKKIQWKE